MSKPLFGQILDPDLKPTRDAVHIPIIPVVADGRIYPRSQLNLHKKDDVVRASLAGEVSSKAIAVVDPFINTVIESGDLFYAWLRPESTYKLWHEWTHRELDR